MRVIVITVTRFSYLLAVATHRLPNYIRTYRKRAGFSQDEVAFLLGASSGAKISRYERYTRFPTLQTALTCEAVFGVPVRELFAGVYEKVKMDTAKRARQLAERFSHVPPNRRTTQKLESLDRLISR
jgi:transcriptional regulator with XRE-family HTH domain